MYLLLVPEPFYFNYGLAVRIICFCFRKKWGNADRCGAPSWWWCFLWCAIKQPLWNAPHSLKLVKQIVRGMRCRSACQHKNSFLFTDSFDHKSMSCCNKEDFSTKKFLRSDEIILSMWVYNEKLYVHSFSGPAHTLTMYDMDGHLINTWAHNDINGEMTAYGCKMSFLGDQISIANISNHYTTLYKLNGEVIRNVPCNTITKESRVTLCHGNGDSVIITDELKSKVMQLNLRTEELRVGVNRGRYAAMCLSLLIRSSTGSKLPICLSAWPENRYLHCEGLPFRF